jgi:hypothetical protein
MRIEKELSKVRSYSALKRVGDRPVYIDGAFSSHMISLLCHSRTGSEEMHTNFRDIVRIHGYTQFSTQKKKNMEDGSLAISSRYRGKLENERWKWKRKDEGHQGMEEESIWSEGNMVF